MNIHAVAKEVRAVTRLLTGGQAMYDAKVEALAEKLLNREVDDPAMTQIEVDFNGRKNEMSLHDVASDRSVGIFEVGHVANVEWKWDSRRDTFVIKKITWSSTVRQMEKDYRDDILGALKRSAKAIGGEILTVSMR
jgi:hypothetical protein